MKPTALIAANRGYALSNSRMGLIRRFLSSGWRVVIATVEDAESHKLTELGAKFEPVFFKRGGLSPASDLAAYRRLLHICKQWKPSLVLHFHGKPVILGTRAARRASGDEVRVVNVITGLGHAFVAEGVIARIVGLGFRAASRYSDITVFQNCDDMALFLHRGWIQEDHARLIVGSGVNSERFALVDRRRRGNHAPIIVMLGRLIRQKGIHEFIEVAKRIRQRSPSARFLLAGEEDRVHPDAVPAEWVKTQPFVEYLGRIADVRPLLAEADLFLFPSYYREGVPRVVLEAASTGLPIVGFKVPGVCEVVTDGENGYLVPQHDIDALTSRVATLLENESLRTRMGRSARKSVERAFDLRYIEEQYFQVFSELGFTVE